MFRRLLIATLIGILAALAVAAFRHAMQLLEWIFLSNDTGSLVNAAEGLSPWRRLITPALGGLAAGLLLWGWQKMNQQRPHAPTDYMEALQTDGQFDVGASLVKSLASLLVVVSGSAIGREGAMILLAALAASSFARRFTPREEWKLWIASASLLRIPSAVSLLPLATGLYPATLLPPDANACSNARETTVFPTEVSVPVIKKRFSITNSTVMLRKYKPGK